jgi:nanoRNase/pAp phosphatase (c-di-AMP/oligoRNAs hydrolase)
MALNGSMRISEHQYGDQISLFKNVLYLCHRNADPDAIGCSFARKRVDNRKPFCQSSVFIISICLDKYLSDPKLHSCGIMAEIIYKEKKVIVACFAIVFIDCRSFIEIHLWVVGKDY